MLKEVAMSVSLFGLVLLGACGGNGEDTDEPDEQSGQEEAEMERLLGSWVGDIDLQGTKLPIEMVFHDGEGHLNIPMQNLHEHPLDLIEVTEDDVYIEMQINGQTSTFDGGFNGDDDITGTYTESNQPFDFSLRRGSIEDDEENVNEDIETATIDVAGGTMKGVIERPKSEGPYPVALIHAGSGPTDKDGNTMMSAGKNNSLKMLAEALAENGIASIRYDKRNLGDNRSLATVPNDLVLEDFIGDAAAWLAYAQGHDDFEEVVMVGHSEGALIGTIASTQQQVDALVLLAGPGRPLDEMMLEQFGSDPQVSEDLLQEMERLLEQIKNGEIVEEMSDELVGLFQPTNQLFLTSLFAYDPSEELAKVERPILVMNGTTDLQVKEEDAERLTSANSLAELQLIEGMNHVLKEASEDREENFETYGNPNLPLADGLVDSIVRFINDLE